MNNQLIAFHRPEAIVTKPRGASGTLRHVTPVIVRQPSLIERLTATAKRIVASAKYAVLRVSTGKLFSLAAVLAVASWIWG